MDHDQKGECQGERPENKETLEDYDTFEARAHSMRPHHCRVDCSRDQSLIHVASKNRRRLVFHLEKAPAKTVQRSALPDVYHALPTFVVSVDTMRYNRRPQQVQIFISWKAAHPSSPPLPSTPTHLEHSLLLPIKPGSRSKRGHHGHEQSLPTHFLARLITSTNVFFPCSPVRTGRHSSSDCTRSIWIQATRQLRSPDPRT